MSKIVTMTRNLGEYLPRYDGVKFQKTGNKTVQTATIVVPDKRGELIKRVGKYSVEENKKPNEVVTTFVATILPSADVFHDDNYDLSAANQTATTIEKVNDNTYKIKAKSEDLNAFPSTNPAQGTHKWIGIVIDTGESTIVGLKFNGKTLTEDDAEEAAEVKQAAGHIIYWYKYDLGKSVITINKGDNTSAISFISAEA